MPFLVWNPKDYTVYLKSYDGDSVPIAGKTPRAGARVANKFDWQIPTFMRVQMLDEEEKVCPTTLVKGRTPIPARKPPRRYNQASQPVPQNTLTAAQMREKVSRKKAEREVRAQYAATQAKPPGTEH